MPLSVLSLKVPRESENTPEQTAQLLASLAKATKSPNFILRTIGRKRVFISLEVTLVNGQTLFTIVFPSYLESFIQSQMLATYQDVVMKLEKDYMATWDDAPPYMTVIRQSSAAYFPLRDYTDYKEVDPMLPLLGVLSKANPEEKILLQFVLTPPSKGIASQAYRYLHPKDVDANGKPLTTLNPGEKKIIEDKISQPLVGVSIRFASTNQQIIHDLWGAVSVLNRPDGNSLVRARIYPWDKKHLWKLIRDRKPLRSLTIPLPTLNVMELSSLWHLPGVYTKLANIAWAPSAALLEAPEDLPVFVKEGDNSNTNFFATTVYKNQQVTFGIKLEDRLRHMYILGKSGTGKSTLLENMAVDDFKKGRGIAFIDPHGDSAENLLNYIPKNRINETVYFNPSDREFPISLNMLEVSSPDQAELVASGIVAIFHKLYGHSWGPRLEYILRNTLLTLTQVPGSTLPDVIRMLTDSAFRKKVYPKLTNQQLLSFWEKDFDRLDDRARMENIGSILNKVGQFVNSPLIHEIISRPKSTVNLKEVLDSGKIFIANLSQGKLGEDNSALLGAMLVTQIELAAMSRVDLPKDQRKEFFLYVDEFQNFATESFIKILSEARKFRLGLTMANQYIAQIPETIQQAIFGNAGTTISFVMGADDARIMEKEFGEKFDANSLVSLQKHQIALKMTIDGAMSRPFSAITLPPLSSTNQNKDKVITVSRERYAVKKKALPSPPAGTSATTVPQAEPEKVEVTKE